MGILEGGRLQEKTEDNKNVWSIQGVQLTSRMQWAVNLNKHDNGEAREEVKEHDSKCMLTIDNLLLI